MTSLSTGADPVGQLSLPRLRSGFQPQHVLLTLLGDHWYGNPQQLPSAGLVQLLAEFGVTSAGARAALSRLARRDLLDSSKRGRRTFYGLSARAGEVLTAGWSRILNFGSYERRWDGTWTMVAFSVPEEYRHTRHALRTRLRWQGFAPLYDGLWVSPHSGATEVEELLRALSVEAATVFEGRAAGVGGKTGDPIQAWDVGWLRQRYQDFVDATKPLVEALHAGRLSAHEALRGRVMVMDTWRTFPNLDPELPVDLLPEKWPRRAARAAFVEIYDGLGPLAETRVREVLADYDRELAGLVSHHTTRQG